MVTIKNVKTITKNDGEKFHCLICEGNVEPAISASSGRIYFTVRHATVPTTFDEKTCKSLIGAEFNGDIKKVECEEYDYTIEDTGETIKLSHRWEFVDESLELLEKHMVKEKETSSKLQGAERLLFY